VQDMVCARVWQWCCSHVLFFGDLFDMWFGVLNCFDYFLFYVVV